MKPFFAAVAVTAVLSVLSAPPAPAQTLPAAPASPAVRTAPVGLPQDAGPHDASTIEWWYVNAFLQSETGRQYAVVASFFRTGLTPTAKGHFLIHALTDLDSGKTRTFSQLDQANVNLLRMYLPLALLQNPNDKRPAELLQLLQKNELPAPHRLLPTAAKITTQPRFSLEFGENKIAQTSADARTWASRLSGDDFSLDLMLAQNQRSPMRVGGAGKTGLSRPDDMFYLSLTRMQASGKLTVDGKTETVEGVGWLDRQWGTSWVVQDNGWDWFGLHLDDGSDLIVYQIRDNKTGKILRAEATRQLADGTQTVEKAPVFTTRGSWTDPATTIAYPRLFTITLPKTGLTLQIAPVFDAQTIPVIGIGDAIWEGVVYAVGRTGAGKPITGRGYRELVGYRPAIHTR